MPFDGTSTSAQYEIKSLLARTFERAAEIIETKGLVQGNLHGRRGEVCCYQAITEAAEEIGSDFGVAVQTFQKSVKMYVCTWNNEPGRTKEEAAAAFRKAAKASA